jgi:hypothetical protein
MNERIQDLKWCNACGEGVVTFCRGDGGDTGCPMKLPNPPNHSQLSITDEARRYARHQQVPDREGFFDVYPTHWCIHPSHQFPSGLYIPPGKKYRHVCPGCGSTQTVIAPEVS